MDAYIYHNPRCSKSRQTLELLKKNGVQPVVVEYLNNTPTTDRIKKLIELLGVKPRDIIRKKEEAYKVNNLANKELSDDELIMAMAKDPILIERPIVAIGDKAVIGRPPENVLDILPAKQGA